MRQFTDTQFMPAAEKRQVQRRWTRFLGTLANHFGDKGRCFATFSQPLYRHLIQHCSFIAHYDRSGFFHTYFATSDGARRFVRQFDRREPRWSWHQYSGNWWLRGEYADINEAMREVAAEFGAAICRAAAGRATARRRCDRQKLRGETRDHAPRLRPPCNRRLLNHLANKHPVWPPLVFGPGAFFMHNSTSPQAASGVPHLPARGDREVFTRRQVFQGLWCTASQVIRLPVVYFA